MRAMVMAAGLGTRLRPITNQVPKPVVPVGNVAIVEQLVRLVALQPGLQQRDMLRFVHVCHGNLVRAEAAFRLLAVDFFGAGPAFR